jgi:cytochrome c553
MPGRGGASRVRALPILGLGACLALGTALFASHAWTQPRQPENQPPPQQTPPQPTAPPQAQMQGDARRGKAISYTCLGCHGIDGYKNAYPMYSVPKLEGQNPQYLEAALHGYRDGDRAHLTMHAQASTLSDQDIADIAAYFAGTPLKPTGKAPTSLPKAATLCTSCHGQDGVAVAVIYPSLAGQHEDYLERALDEYQRGGRKNPIMKTLVATLKPDDIEVIAAYFSGLSPSLQTEKRPYTRFGSE